MSTVDPSRFPYEIALPSVLLIVSHHERLFANASPQSNLLPPSGEVGTERRASGVEGQP
jgi:hypothetical protein